jgi:2-haloacid dehalogenase
VAQIVPIKRLHFCSLLAQNDFIATCYADHENKAMHGESADMLRRTFLTSGLGLAGTLLSNPIAAAVPLSTLRAIAFDAFPIFDPRSVAARCEALFPGRGGELVALWRTRQFEYAWLRTVSNRYADFERVTADALAYAADALKLHVTAGEREQLLRAHFELRAWPDALPALTRLRETGLRLAFLSNFTPDMLDGCIEFAGIAGLFDRVLSTDAARTYKPNPRAYELGTAALGLPREQILFVAFAGWDAAGAKTFGYPTFWVNRLGLPPEHLGVQPDGTGADLDALLAFLQ